MLEPLYRKEINSAAVIRFVGQELSAGSRIAVLANDAIGNFVATTPLMQMLRSRYPEAELHYFGGERTRELQEASDLADHTHLFLGMSPAQQAQLMAEGAATFDLVVNVEQTALTKVLGAVLCKEGGFVCGPTMGAGGRGDLPFADDLRGDLWRDKQWIAPDLCAKYPILDSPFIGEIFCRLAYLDGQVPGYRLPSTTPPVSVPDVIVSASASLTEKLWPYEKWEGVLRWLRSRGFRVGLVGAKPSFAAAHWHGDAEPRMVDEGLVEDLRGKMSLPEVVGALKLAKLVFTIDNGILHLACGANTPTIGLYREGIHRLWAPPAKALTVLHPEPGSPVADIGVDAALEAIERAL